MPPNALATWHELVRTRNPAGLDTLLDDDVVFYSPVVHTPQRGKTITALYLGTAFHVFFDDSFRYVREIHDDNGAVLEFEVEIDGIAVNGVDMLKWNEVGRIVEFKVMIRPLQAINLVHQKMAALLASARKDAG